MNLSIQYQNKFSMSPYLRWLVIVSLVSLQVCCSQIHTWERILIN